MNEEETHFRKGMLEVIALCTRNGLYAVAKEYLDFYKSYTQGYLGKAEIGASLTV